MYFTHLCYITFWALEHLFIKKNKHFSWNFFILSKSILWQPSCIPEFISPSFTLHSRVHFTKFYVTFPSYFTKFYLSFPSSFHQGYFTFPSSFHQVILYIPEFISPSFTLHPRVHFTKLYFTFLSLFQQVLLYIPEFIWASFILHSRVHFTKFYFIFQCSFHIA